MRHFKNLKTVVISILLVLSFSSVKAQKKHSYIEKHKEIAAQLSQEYGIPSTVILAVAFVESGGGTSKNSQILNNHFGIVGKNTVNKSRYRSFLSTQDSFRAFCDLLSRKKYYQRLKGNDDHSEWVKAIAKAGYSTQPQEWMRRINLMIKKIEPQLD
ncbi:glucosaminidase domain-containing protein [Bergeyella cardium]|uniref:Muramidase n=1 Tax=Bergeyella cardium TaxID=1585976 RepID=A0A6P1QSK5_9FLAO|nr:glucosaminidase domain-containing protein [Bergeyella cardium]QHN64448.1 muramidase [Bergeyella cardium]WHE33738.1 glucosaminidase domain-containing protein [Bergeyella cardium]WHF60388.1 glucosaminidase domain-containing protein [Bergeyella cardium]